MISDEAVNAAQKAHIALSAAQDYKFPQEYAEAMLEAAAPYIAARAWDEGCSEGLLVNNGWEEGALDANPYRSQA
jgi:hypothetical protein